MGKQSTAFHLAVMHFIVGEPPDSPKTKAQAFGGTFLQNDLYLISIRYD